MNISKLALLGSTVLVALTMSDFAFAQTDDQIETVMVTARKVSEDQLKVPGALTAYSAADLATLDIKSLSDIAAYTPGLENDQTSSGGARSDRSFQQLIIRGMTPSGTANPTTSVFINGVPVAAPDFLQVLDDVQHVEVLKGPQSAFFGRETFAGAINVVATMPGNDFAANGYAELGSLNTTNVSGNVTVPIIDEKLSARVGGFYDKNDGSYTNAFNRSQTLGDQSTKGLHLAIAAEPIENLSIKAFGMIFQENDGPAATGLILSGTNNTFDQSNCTITTRITPPATSPYVCGTLPGLISSVSPAQNTTITPGIQYFFDHPGGSVGASDSVKHFGLKRNAYHADINVEYAIPSLGLTATYLGGINSDRYSELSDLSNIDGALGGQYPGYTGFPFVTENSQRDFSHEFRIANDPDAQFRFLVGASYVQTRAQGALGSVGAVPALKNGVPPPDVPGGGIATSDTAGVFFSLGYDILPELTLTFDGRYQHDYEAALAPKTSTNPFAQQASGSSSDFLPRVSLRYNFAPEFMTYFTYSQGVNPGTFNTQILAIPAVSQAELTANGAGLVVQPEHLTNYEIGTKGRFLDGRATLSADVYYDKWDNQLVQDNFIFAANDPANPYNVVGGLQYRPGNTAVDQIQVYDNSANSTAKGFELEGELIPVDNVKLNLAGAITDTTYDKLLCPSGTCKPYLMFVDASGKHLPYAPEYSLNFGAEYDGTFEASGTHNWYVRGDYIYRSGVYVTPANTSKTQDINLVNLRAGINVGNAGLEVYVNNVFNNKSYTTAFANSNFFNFAPNAVMTGLPQLINGGVRLRYEY